MDRLSDALLRDMAAKGIDADLTLSILADYNSGLYDSVRPVEAKGVPAVDGKSVISLAGPRRGGERVAGAPALGYSVAARDAKERLGELGLEAPASAREGELGQAVFDEAALEEIGTALLGRTAYGVLNGGSATSYADSKKNLAFGQAAFDALEPFYDALAPLCRDRPKGLTPAYLEPDLSPGESFLLLKMRARLVAALRAKERGEEIGDSFMPLFQMTSVSNDAELAAAYAEYAKHPLIAPLAARLGIEGCRWATGVQPMLAAYTHSSEGRPKRVFDRSHGKSDSAIALPGGHGQCFRILAPTLRALRDRGVRFAYLGNVDNLGYVPDPVEIAVLALSGQPAAFDFSLRTSVDVKGGILVETSGDAPEGEARRTVADIGPAISFDEVRRLEAAGSSILFNCAIGLFDLDWLVPRLDEIGRGLPVRFTDQDKDAGRYSQAEQVTWEVAGILPGFLAFAVDKYDRFIAAKLLAETLLTSGAAAGDGRIPPGLADTSRRLKAALERKLAGPYGLEKRGGQWAAADSIG
jgi:UTP--glucose-1-phosphate uridylyltransferase